jgi:hypothetical protein
LRNIHYLGYYFYFGLRTGYWAPEGTKSTRRRGIFEAILFRISCRHLPINTLVQWWSKCAPQPKGTSTSYQGIRGYIPIMNSLEFTYFLNWRNNVLLNVLEELS